MTEGVSVHGSERDADSLAGRSLAGRWVLERSIGRGAFSEVWLARHRITRGVRAIKLLSPSLSLVPHLVERFVREAQVAAGIDSPHLVEVDDVGFDEGIGRAFIVMEWLRGESLYEYLQHPPGPMSPSSVLFVLSQVGDALDAAHAAGVVHRDLKPENIFLSWRDDGAVIVKLLDFGILKQLPREADSTGERRSTPGTPSGAIAFHDLVRAASTPDEALDTPSHTQFRTAGFLGTPGYAAPEQLVESGTVTARADVYALGMCAFEMLAGEPYWSDAKLARGWSDVLEGAREFPSQRAAKHFDAAFDAWFVRACDVDPARRFARASEAIDELAQALGLGGNDEPPLPRAVVPVLRDATGRYRAPHWSRPDATANPISGPPAAPTRDATVTPNDPIAPVVRLSTRRLRIALTVVCAAAAVAIALSSWMHVKKPGAVDPRTTPANIAR